ncbi:MAG: DUF4388 domain-containing protein [Acidobacteriota bacterium]
MIPNEEQLLEIANLRQGDLSEIPFAVLLHAMAVHEKSGVLEFERKPMKKDIVLDAGVPVDCRSNLLHETLGRFMVGQGHLTDAESQHMVAMAAQRGVQVGEVLISEGKVNPSELYRILQQNLARKLLDGFTWRSGRFRVLARMDKVESPLKVNVPQLVLTGISKFTLDEEVNSAVSPLVGKRLALHPAPPFPLDELRLSRNQQQLVELLGTGKRIDELAAETTIPFDQIMRLLYSLAVIGLVVPQDWLPREVVPTPPRERSRRAARSAAEQPAAPTETSAEQRDRVMEAYLRFRKQDAFDLFGLAEDADLGDIRDAYLDWSRRFAPWSLDASLRDKGEDLFVAAGQAFGELCDAERRNQLLHRRKTLREERERRPDPNRFAIKSDLLDPETSFKKGKALAQKNQYHEAVKQLQFAYDCDPQNSIYRAELAYTKFLDKPDLEGQRALDELRETLRIDPKCGLALYYRGMVEMELGQFDDAEGHLQRAIKLMMPDRRPIEGLKELQTRQSKKKKRLFG